MRLKVCERNSFTKKNVGEIDFGKHLNATNKVKLMSRKGNFVAEHLIMDTFIFIIKNNNKNKHILER
jgi:hypothetical protein